MLSVMDLGSLDCAYLVELVCWGEFPLLWAPVHGWVGDGQ